MSSTVYVNEPVNEFVIQILDDQFLHATGLELIVSVNFWRDKFQCFLILNKISVN